MEHGREGVIVLKLITLICGDGGVVTGNLADFGNVSTCKFGHLMVQSIFPKRSDKWSDSQSSTQNSNVSTKTDRFETRLSGSVAAVTAK